MMRRGGPSHRIAEHRGRSQTAVFPNAYRNKVQERGGRHAKRRKGRGRKR